MARKKFIEVREIIAHAESMGYTNAQANEYIWDAEIQPMYELNQRDWNRSAFEDDSEYTFEPETRLIMRSFFDKIKRTSITVIKD